MSRKFVHLLLGGVAVTAACPVFAQDTATAPVADGDSGSEIVVTAQKRAENLQDVPVSIAAFSSETLAAANIDEVEELSALTPNFSVNKATASAAVRINIRGVGASGNTATEPSVAVFLDGIYVPRAGSTIATFLDIDGVEVLRGPQGTLFGRNASVGALSLRTAQPEFTFSGEVTGEVGNADRYRLAGHVNLPLNDKVAVRLAAAGSWFDGFWFNEYDGMRYGQQDDAALRGSVKAELGNLEWIVRADYTKISGDGVTDSDFDASSVSPTQLAQLRTILGGDLPDTNFNDRVMNYAVTADLDDRQWGLSSDATFSLGDSKIRLINSYRDWRNDQLDGDVIFLPLPLLSRQSYFDSKSQNHELQFISPTEQWLGGKLDLVAGLYYFDEEYRLGEVLNLGSRFCNTLLPAGAARDGCNAFQTTTGGANATTQRMAQNTTSYAVYGQLNYRLAEPLTLVLGGRWTHEEKSGSFAQSIATPVASILRAPETLTLPDLSESRLTYRIGLNFKPTDDVMLFGSYSTGYKSGGYNSGGGTPSLSTFDQAGNLVSTRRVFGRETVDNYEVGIKSEWLDRALTANLTFYRMDINGYQDRSFDGVSFIIRNAGSLRQQGFEFDTVLRPSRNFTVNAALAYLDSEFTSFPGGSPLPGLPAGSVQDLTGTRANFSPAWSGQVGFNWKGDIGNSGMSWSASSNVNFVSDYRNSQITDNNPQTIQDGYALLSARLTLAGVDDRWSVAIFGNNLTNVQYSTVMFNQTLAGAFGLNNGVFPGSTAIRQTHASPRTYGASLTLRF